MKKDAEIEKFRAEGVKRETAERKEMDELQTEMRAKDVRIQALGKEVRVHAQQDTGSQDKGELQRKLKAEQRLLREREDQLNIREEQSKAMQRTKE